MGVTVKQSDATRAFIDRLDEAVSRGEPAAICAGVKEVLTAAPTLPIPTALREPSPDGYARRLLHRNPELDYSVMVMVWNPGQGTPIHDHAGHWCVEGLAEGCIEITPYTPVSDPDAPVVQFAEGETVCAQPGDVGVLVPPNEYHRIRNVEDRKAVTIHVYAGEMLWCHSFEPDASGGYRRERCVLTHTPPRARSALVPT